MSSRCLRGARLTMKWWRLGLTNEASPWVQVVANRDEESGAMLAMMEEIRMLREQLAAVRGYHGGAEIAMMVREERSERSPVIEALEEERNRRGPCKRAHGRCAPIWTWWPRGGYRKKARGKEEGGEPGLETGRTEGRGRKTTTKERMAEGKEVGEGGRAADLTRDWCDLSWRMRATVAESRCAELHREALNLRLEAATSPTAASGPADPCHQLGSSLGGQNPLFAAEGASSAAAGLLPAASSFIPEEVSGASTAARSTGFGLHSSHSASVDPLPAASLDVEQIGGSGDLPHPP